MRVWLLQIGETLPLDKQARHLRTAIVAEKLVQRGHTVVWWASALDHFTKEWICRGDQNFFLGPNFEIKALKGMKYEKNISLSRLLDHRLIARKFRKMAAKEAKPDLIVASYPSYDLAYEGVRYAKGQGIPVLLDIRDQWPDFFLHHVPAGLRQVARLCLSYEFHLARSAMVQADGLLSMMDNLLQWGLDYTQRQKTWKDRVFYLGYRRPVSPPPPSQGMVELLFRLKNKFVVTYIGTFSDYHNPQILVEAAARLAHTDIIFVLAGEGMHSKALKAAAANLPNVEFPGWLDAGDISALVDSSHVGVCPTTKKVHFFPNKAFVYFSAGLPVISAFEGDLKQLLTKYNLGFYYPPNEPETLLRQLLTLYEERRLYLEMRDNVIAAYGELFDADTIYENYINHLISIKHNRH
jgi:glycosyltransferase involved in cell wall biosynthesis